MGTGSLLHSSPSQLEKISPYRGGFRLVLRWVFISTVVIFLVETLVMLILEHALHLPQDQVLFLDGLLLVTLLFPLNFFLILRPMARQVEEHQLANLELAKSSIILDRFFSITDILIAYLDADFNFIRVNQVYADTDQRDAAYFPGKNHFDLFPNEDNLRIFREVVRTGRSYTVSDKPFEYANNPERGVTYWDWSLLPIKDPEGRVIALLLILNNVTSRKQAQLAKQESDLLLRAAFEQAFQHVGFLKPTGEVMDFNQTTLNFTGTTQEELAGKYIWELPWWVEPAERLDEMRSRIQQSTGEVLRCEHRVRFAQGDLAIMDVSIKPFQDHRGQTSLLLYEARDISAHIESKEALQESEEKIRQLYQAELNAHRLVETLRSAALALSGSLDSDTVLKTLLDHLHIILPYTSAHVGLLGDEDHLVIRLARGEEKWGIRERLLGKWLDICSLPSLEYLMRDRQSLYTPDTALVSETSFLPDDRFVRCWVGIPLLAGDQVVGACILEHECPNSFTQEQVRWASALTSQAAMAIQNAWLFEQVRDSREHMQALSRSLVEAHEAERRYISRELHDEAGQALASLMVGLRLLERDGEDNPEIITRTRELKQIADGVLESLHRLAVDLRPASLDHIGLVAALRQHIEMVSDQNQITIQFETVGKIERLPEEMETAIYRIVQEALTNVIRHASATRVDVILEHRQDLLIVIVEDNGIGFDPKNQNADRLGILGMRERAEMLGGSLTLESAPGKGATVFLEVPCPFES